MEIRATIGYNEDRKIGYFVDFDLVDEVPKIGDTYKDERIISIEEIDLDCSECDGKRESYNFFKIKTKNVDSREISCYYICTEIFENRDILVMKKLNDNEVKIIIKNDAFLNGIKSEEIVRKGYFAIIYNKLKNKYDLFDDDELLDLYYELNDYFGCCYSVKQNTKKCFSFLIKSFNIENI